MTSSLILKLIAFNGLVATETSLLQLYLFRYLLPCNIIQVVLLWFPVQSIRVPYKKDVCLFFSCFTSHSNLPNANSSQQQTVDHWGNQQMTLVSHAKQVEMKWMNMPDYVWPHVIAKAYH